MLLQRERKFEVTFCFGNVKTSDIVTSYIFKQRGTFPRGCIARLGLENFGSAFLFWFGPRPRNQMAQET